MEVLKLHQKLDRVASIASIKKPDMQSSTPTRGSSQASSTQVSSTQSGTTQVSSSSSRPSVTFDPAEPMPMNTEGSAAATGGGDDADSSWEAQVDRKEQFNEAHGQGSHPSRPRR